VLVPLCYSWGVLPDDILQKVVTLLSPAAWKTYDYSFDVRMCGVCSGQK
jgi:hypothetical protein